ncbi:helix-turn-helix domain-containing protein [Speluncibacter jeojiensis]|uniref:TetR/AcrR family transcriptional regulator n=1 Tax=Speluncibacter jeojiensis TaxID=2710754 RepID=A0A9X4RFY0_9ACTN|nr:TetR/AcrR family transcriptional regulator [Corynebacteriales bacterium D3-21]
MGTESRDRTATRRRSSPVTAAAPRRTRPANRKATILAVASERFAREGYHRTSMADIAAEVGISSTALYRHFRNKQDLLGRTLIDGLDRTLAGVQQAVGHPEQPDGESGPGQPGPAPDPVLAESIIAGLVDQSLTHRRLTALWQREVKALSEEDRRAVLVRVARVHRWVLRAVTALRPELDAGRGEMLAWFALSAAVSPTQHNVQLPRAVFAAQLRELTTAVIHADLPAAPATPSASDGDGVGEAGASPTVRDGSVDRVLRRELLIAAATRLFDERGYAAVGIEDIGAAAGISGPSVYHHFGSKAELLAEIVDRNEQWIRLYTARAMRGGGTSHESLVLLLRSYAEFAIEHPDLIGTTVTEVVHLPVDEARRCRRAHREGVVTWARLLQVVRPELTVDQARVAVQAATAVVGDAVRNGRLRARPHLADELVAAGTALLLGRGDESGSEGSGQPRIS